MTDSEGRFVFEKVRPGQWELSVIAARVPDHYYIEQDKVQISLEPGQEENVSIRVLPRKRHIEMFENGGTLVEESL